VKTPRTTLVFEIGDRVCGIAAEDVREAVLVPALSRLPGQPAVLEGFLNLRGAAVPVVKLDRLLDAGDRPLSLHTPLLILEARGGEASALAVDRIDDVLSVPAEEFRPVGKEQSFNECAIAEFPFGGRGAALLDTGRILLEKERQCIAELRGRVQAQLDSLGRPAA
jgi:purine-binding chemotaxis protein CheW